MTYTGLLLIFFEERNLNKQSDYSKRDGQCKGNWRGNECDPENPVYGSR